MQDVLGRDIYIGDVITYPVHKGSNLDVFTAIVRGFTGEKIRVDTLEVCFQYVDGERDSSGYVVRTRETHLSVPERLTVTDLSGTMLRSLREQQAEEQNVAWRKRLENVKRAQEAREASHA